MLLIIVQVATFTTTIVISLPRKGAFSLASVLHDVSFLDQSETFICKTVWVLNC